MSFEFKPNVRYRMPVMFGPAPGPRQKATGVPWEAQESGTANVQWATIAYRSDPAMLEALLPPGFTLAEPVVHVTLGFFRNLYWLAGRGYGIVNVEIPVVCSGRDQRIEGGLCLVLWEGRPDAITTGREELGFPKLYADIRISGSMRTAGASAAARPGSSTPSSRWRCTASRRSRSPRRTAACSVRRAARSSTSTCHAPGPSAAAAATCPM